MKDNNKDNDTLEFTFLCIGLVLAVVVTFIIGNAMGIEEFMLW